MICLFVNKQQLDPIIVLVDIYWTSLLFYFSLSFLNDISYMFTFSSLLLFSTVYIEVAVIFTATLHVLLLEKTVYMCGYSNQVLL